MDKADWHTTKHVIVLKSITLWFIAPYFPELNPVELIWRELMVKYFNNKTFESQDELDKHLELALTDLQKLNKINCL